MFDGVLNYVSFFYKNLGLISIMTLSLLREKAVTPRDIVANSETRLLVARPTKNNVFMNRFPIDEDLVLIWGC